MYIHIPFCRQKCSYCAFNSITDLTKKSSYLEALRHELYLKSRNNTRVLRTIYIGGGTPSLLTIDELLSIVSAIHEGYELELSEFTLEQNPESMTEASLEAYREMGINRISIGVQAFSDRALTASGRLHDSATAIDRVKLAKKYFDNVSLDLMLSLPGADYEEERLSVLTACELDVSHISMYTLTLERGTPLYKRVKRGEVLLASDDSVADSYYRLSALLKQQGYSRYEISNFAKVGMECKHNLNYWRQGEYIGVGVSAAGFERGVRYRNIKSIDDYVSRLAHGRSCVSTSERLSIEDMEKEFIMLSLRTSRGIDSEEYSKRFGKAFDSVYADVLRRLSDYLDKEGAFYRIRDDFIEISNSIIVEFF